MTQVAVIANCQAYPLARVLHTLPGVTASQWLGVHERGTKRYEQAEAELKPLLADPSTQVFTFQISGKHGGYATEALRERGLRVKTITNLYFAGLHPDITYLGGLGARLRSPMGDYHSRILLDAYCAGKSPAECAAMFNGAEYERRGYFKAYDESAAALLAREEQVDVKFASEFLAMVREQPTLFTMNHPTGPVFQSYGALLAKELGMSLPQFPAAYVNNPLAESAWWPVYDEIAEQHGLGYRTPLVFRQPNARGARLMNLTEFIERSYALYRKLGEAVSQTWAATTPAASWATAAG